MIWTTRNNQVLRNQRAAKEIFNEKLAHGLECHSLFSTKEVTLPHPQIDPYLPQGFTFASLGRHKIIFPDALIQIDGSWDKIIGIAWAA